MKKIIIIGLILVLLLSAIPFVSGQKSKPVLNVVTLYKDYTISKDTGSTIMNITKNGKEVLFIESDTPYESYGLNKWLWRNEGKSNQTCPHGCVVVETYKVCDNQYSILPNPNGLTSRYRYETCINYRPVDLFGKFNASLVQFERVDGNIFKIIHKRMDPTLGIAEFNLSKGINNETHYNISGPWVQTNGSNGTYNPVIIPLNQSIYNMLNVTSNVSCNGLTCPCVQVRMGNLSKTSLFGVFNFHSGLFTATTFNDTFTGNNGSILGSGKVVWSDNLDRDYVFYSGETISNTNVLDFGDPQFDQLFKDNFTLSFWYKSGSGNSGTIIGKWWDGSTRNFEIIVSNNAITLIHADTTGGSTKTFNTGISFGTAIWQQLVYRKNTNGSKQLFLNGTSIGGIIEKQYSENNAPLWAMARLFAGGTGNGINGSIDDIIFYGRYLSNEEITNLYLNQYTQFTNPITLSDEFSIINQTMTINDTLFFQLQYNMFSDATADNYLHFSNTTVFTSVDVEPSPVAENLSWEFHPKNGFINTTSQLINYKASNLTNWTIEWGTTVAYGTSINANPNTEANKIIIDGLTANIRYFYRLNVTSGTDTINFTNNFTTLPSSLIDLKICTMSDIHVGNANWVSNTAARFERILEFCRKQEVDLFIFAGDTNEALSLATGQLTYENLSIALFNASVLHIPIYASPGNHDSADGVIGNNLLWNEFYTMPENGNATNKDGTASFNKTTWVINISYMCLIGKSDILNQSQGGDQLNFINGSIRGCDTSTQWFRFVISHYPYNITIPTYDIYQDLYQNTTTLNYVGHRHSAGYNFTWPQIRASPVYDQFENELPFDFWNDTGRAHFTVLNVNSTVARFDIYYEDGTANLLTQANWTNDFVVVPGPTIINGSAVVTILNTFKHGWW